MIQVTALLSLKTKQSLTSHPSQHLSFLPASEPGFGRQPSPHFPLPHTATGAALTSDQAPNNESRSSILLGLHPLSILMTTYSTFFTKTQFFLDLLAAFSMVDFPYQKVRPPQKPSPSTLVARALPFSYNISGTSFQTAL